MLVKILLFLLATSLGQEIKGNNPFNKEYPDYAECLITWNIPLTCAAVRDKIRYQMVAWEENEHGKEECPGTSPKCRRLPCGQKCRYQFEGIKKDGTLFGHHLTPKLGYRDNITFKFTDERNNKCKVVGFSKSTSQYAYIDYGTNYCNLRNLMDGDGQEGDGHLSERNGFTESTSISICTYYDDINCDRF